MSDMTLREAAEAAQLLARQMRGVMLLAEASDNIVQGRAAVRRNPSQVREAMRTEVENHKTSMRERELATEAKLTPSASRRPMRSSTAPAAARQLVTASCARAERQDHGSSSRARKQLETKGQGQADRGRDHRRGGLTRVDHGARSLADRLYGPRQRLRLHSRGRTWHAGCGRECLSRRFRVHPPPDTPLLLHPLPASRRKPASRGARGRQGTARRVLQTRTIRPWRRPSPR